ncbi:MAG TPA: glycerophosphodiester phosphodiesterase [Kofleriaceae bacterium]|jgi:glycerophosphoryl diester phosphodiesterase
MHPRRLYAHRGASAERPENTMPAFERAVEVGGDFNIALEMDVHLTRDDQLVVAHDDSCFRTTGTQLAWTELTMAEIERLDAGWGFVAPDGERPFAGKSIRAPRFEAVLEAFPNQHINVDIKGAKSVALMLELVRTHRAEERVTIASFQLRTLVEMRRKGYAGETALSMTEVATLAALPGLAWRQLPFTGTAAQVPTHGGPLRFDRPAFIAKCHSVGLRVDFWVIDEPAEAKRLLDLGADGIMTNDPAKLRPVFV